MQIREFLNNVCEQISYKPIREEISKELENHIEERKEMYMEYGVKENEAEEKAIEQMGDAEEIGKKLNKIHRPRIDWKVIFTIVALIILGLIVFYSREIFYETSWARKNERRSKEDCGYKICYKICPIYSSCIWRIITYKIYRL